LHPTRVPTPGRRKHHDWPEVARKALDKARKYGFFLGMTDEWIDKL
jgi:hypothetical protein